LSTIKQHKATWSALAGGAVLLLVLAGCSGDSGGGSTNGQQASGGSPGSGGNSGSVAPGSSGPPMMMGSSGPPMMMGSGGAPAQTAAGPPPTNTTPPPNRPDPFKPWWSTYTPPPPVTTYVPPVRIALYDTAKPDVQPNIEVQEVPNRRVAGILTGNGAYAVFDDGKVVTPGSDVDGYTVAAINPKSVTLKKKVGTRTYVQVVPLTDVGSYTGGGMMGGMPGGMPGMGSYGRMPGMGSGRGMPGMGSGGRGRPGMPGYGSGGRIGL
jgi:hypothetical protein